MTSRGRLRPSKTAGRGQGVLAAVALTDGGDECLQQRPSPGTSPGRVVERQSMSELVAALVGEEVPGHHQVAGGITNPSAPDVHHGSQVAVDDEQV